MLLAASDPSGTLLGVAAIITAVGGFVAILAQLRRGSNGTSAKPPPEPGRDDPDRGHLWAEMLEQLDSANQRADRAEQKLDLCNRERLELLRRAARRK